MKMSVGNVASVVSEYFETVLMPSAAQAGGIKAFTVGFLGGVVSRQTPAMVEQYLPTATAWGLVDSENMLDLDTVYEEATKALAKSPVVVAGYRVDQNDINRMRDIARKYSV